ncbi:MAG: hypothetical protein ACREPM_04565 [Gemmatimonadaceae bacterium]
MRPLDEAELVTHLLADNSSRRYARGVLTRQFHPYGRERPMQDDASRKANQSDQTEVATDKIEELSPKPISDRDAESVKGGRAVLHDDESPKE